MLKNINSNTIVTFVNVVSPQEEDHDDVHDISFSIQEGEFVSFVGPSGCGKTTVMKLIAGVIEKTSGQITAPEDTVMVFQKDSLLPWLTVQENIMLVLIHKKLGNAGKEAIVHEKLQLLQIESLAHAYPKDLSGGQTQRVSIARALATNPRVLILDEPFSALDEKTKNELHKDIVKTWKSHNLTIIMISHQIEEVVLLSERVIVMKEKKIESEYKLPFTYPRNIEDPLVIKKIVEIRESL